MDYFKIVHSLLAMLIFVIAVGNADFAQYDDIQDTGRIPSAVRRYRREDPAQQLLRARRQDGVDSPRYRRQGGHGEGVTGPVHTFVKTDEHAHFKWGVRHHVGHEYAGR